MRTSKKATASPSKITTNSLPRRAGSAGSAVAERARDILQSITTMQSVAFAARFVDFFVQLVTKRWGSSETTRSDLTRQQVTSEILQHEEYWAWKTEDEAFFDQMDDDEYWQYYYEEIYPGREHNE